MKSQSPVYFGCRPTLTIRYERFLPVTASALSMAAAIGFMVGYAI